MWVLASSNRVIRALFLYQCKAGGSTDPSTFAGWQSIQGFYQVAFFCGSTWTLAVTGCVEQCYKRFLQKMFGLLSAIMELRWNYTCFSIILNQVEVKRSQQRMSTINLLIKSLKLPESMPVTSSMEFSWQVGLLLLQSLQKWHILLNNDFKGTDFIDHYQSWLSHIFLLSILLILLHAVPQMCLHLCLPNYQTFWPPLWVC